MDIRLQFGRILRDLRTKRGLTQEELAYRSRMAAQYLSDLERGRHNPTLAMLVDLAKALKLHPTKLLLELKPTRQQTSRKRPIAPNSRQEALLQNLLQGDSVRLAQYARTHAQGVSERQARRDLKELEIAGLIVREGRGRATVYRRIARRA